MKEKAIGRIIAGLLICLILGSVFGGIIDVTSATNEKTTVSVTDSSPWFTKGSNSGHPELWYSHTYQGHDYISTYVGGMSSNPSQPDCWAKFKPYLSQSGKCEVYAYFYACKDTSTKVPFTVKYDGGSMTIKVNQYRSSPAWKEKYLGTWIFKAGADTYVKVTDATGETYNGVTGLSVGAIKFVKVQTTTVPSPPTLISPGSSSEPGQEINTLTPTFKWNSVSNTDYYGLYVSKYPYGSSNIVFEKEGIYGTSFTLPSGKLQDGVKYRWNMRAHNSAGWSGFSSKLYFRVNLPNSPPNTLSRPSGPSSGYTGTSYGYSTSATDPDGDQVKYTFDWGDGTTSETNFVNSGTSASKSHSWSSAGTYSVKAKAADSKGSSSGWSSSKTVTITQPKNPPNTLSRPSGPSSGYTGTSYGYSTSATDPDGDQVKYTFDWGDEQQTTTGFYNSGATATASHSWSNEGTYYVKVKAMDIKGASSGWSGSKTVTITKQNRKPVAYTDSISPNPAKQGQTVSFTGHGTDPDGDLIIAYNWRSSINGFLSSSKSFIRSDLSVGTHTIYFKVKDSHGLWSNEATKSLTINPAPQTGTIIVTANLDQATFTITGPKTYHGSGKSWITSDAPAGIYTITYGDASGYITPSSENKTLCAGGSITFSRTYVHSGNGDLGVKAANLAKQVIGAPYLGDGKTYGGKGWNWNPKGGWKWKDGRFVDSVGDYPSIKGGYYYYDPITKKGKWGQGLDCSGLVFWAFNKAAGKTKYIGSSNPVYERGASGQWYDTERFDQISNEIPTVSDLKTGYLLFLDTPPLGSIEHVGMYVGNGYVLHSRGGVGVENKTLNDWLNLPVAGKKYKDYFVGYGRVRTTSLSENPFNYQGQYVFDISKLRSEEKTALPYVMKYAKEYKISPALIMAIIRQESNFNPNAKSSTGAVGYMQMTYIAAKDAGYTLSREQWSKDGLDPDTNIKYGSKYLRILYNKYKNKNIYDSPLKNVISAYYSGHPTKDSEWYVNQVIKGRDVIDRQQRGYNFFLTITQSSSLTPIPIPTATLGVTPNPAYVGEEPITIKVDGKDDVDVKYLYAYYKGGWHRYECIGTQTRCSHSWTISENSPGKYIYKGYIYDNENNGAWSTPKYIEVTVKS